MYHDLKNITNDMRLFLLNKTEKDLLMRNGNDIRFSLLQDWQYFIYFFLILAIFILLVLLICKNCFKKKVFNSKAINLIIQDHKLVQKPPSRVSSYSQVLSYVLTATKNSNNLDKNKLNNAKIREYFTKRMKEDGNKAFQEKIVEIFNKPVHSTSQTVDSETHNILTRISAIPIIHVKTEESFIQQ